MERRGKGGIENKQQNFLLLASKKVVLGIKQKKALTKNAIKYCELNKNTFK